jgi:hypothetical protein
MSKNPEILYGKGLSMMLLRKISLNNQDKVETTKSRVSAVLKKLW